jgi:hypothetical protein
MSAKEMFEELGYTLKYKNKYEIKYIKLDKTLSNILKEDYYDSAIIINLYRKDIHKNGCYIKLNEFKAIQQQIKELGWESDK